MKSVFNKTYCDTSVREDPATKEFNQSAIVTTTAKAADALRCHLTNGDVSIIAQDAPSTDEGPQVRFALRVETQQGKKTVPVYKNVDVSCEEAVNFALAIIFTAVGADDAFRKQLAELEASLQRRREVAAAHYADK
jgi:hypothetical protein